MSRSTELESMSKEDVSIWLDTKGYSDSMKAAFTGENNYVSDIFAFTYVV